MLSDINDVVRVLRDKKRHKIRFSILPHENHYFNGERVKCLLCVSYRHLAVYNPSEVLPFVDVIIFKLKHEKFEKSINVSQCILKQFRNGYLANV